MTYKYDFLKKQTHIYTPQRYIFIKLPPFYLLLLLNYLGVLFFIYCSSVKKFVTFGLMKVLLNIYRFILNTIDMIMCATCMRKQYVFIKKSTVHNKFKQRF